MFILPIHFVFSVDHYVLSLVLNVWIR